MNALYLLFLPLLRGFPVGPGMGTGCKYDVPDLDPNSCVAWQKWHDEQMANLWPTSEGALLAWGIAIVVIVCAIALALGHRYLQKKGITLSVVPLMPFFFLQDWQIVVGAFLISVVVISLLLAGAIMRLIEQPKEVRNDSQEGA